MLDVNLLRTTALPMVAPQSQLPLFSQAAFGQSSNFSLVSAAQRGFTGFAGCSTLGAAPLLAQTPAPDYTEIPMSPMAAEVSLGLAALALLVYGVDIAWQARVQSKLLTDVGAVSSGDEIFKQLLNDIKYTQPSPIFHPIRHDHWVRDMDARILRLPKAQ